MRAEPDPDADRIHIRELELFARVGVPETERATPQRLVANIDIWPAHDFAELDDALARTVDYAAIAESAREFARREPHKLLETLADQLARHLLSRFAMSAIVLELRKFPLADAKHVAVTVTRRAIED